MKTHCLNLGMAVVLAAACSVLTGCGKEETVLLESRFAEEALGNDIMDFNNNWENFTAIPLDSGKVVNLPWTDPTITIIPDEFRKDIKKEDGWELIYNSFPNPGLTDAYYLILYNRVRGILKGFHYCKKQLSNQNTAMWVLSFQTPQGLLNSWNYFTEPYNSAAKRDFILVSTLTDEFRGNGFQQGWNAFQTEVAYMPAPAYQTLTISGKNQTTSKIELEGSFTSESTGYIIAKTNDDANNLKGLASATGNAAVSLLNKKVDKSEIKSPEIKGLIKGLGAAGIKAVLNSAVKLIFGSFTGTSTPTVMDLQFNTHGNAVFTGSISTDGVGNIVPLSGVNVSKSAIGFDLGVWNLAEAPVIEFDRYSEVRPREGGMPEDLLLCLPDYRVYYDVVLNPNVRPLVESWSSSYDIVRYEYYFTEPKLSTAPSEFPAYPGERWEKDIPKYATEELYRDNYVCISESALRDVPIPIVGDSRLTRYDWVANGDGIRSDHAVKVTVTLHTNIGGKKGTVYSTKTFVPKYRFRTY